LSRNNQDSTFPSFSDYTDSDTTVDTIQQEDILDTVSKPIRTTYYKRWNNPVKQLILPGGVFHNQGFFYVKHLHHPKAYVIDTLPNYGYISHGRFFHCNKLVILQALRNCPEKILDRQALTTLS
jgi:hypothetical protein